MQHPLSISTEIIGLSFIITKWFSHILFPFNQNYEKKITIYIIQAIRFDRPYMCINEAIPTLIL